VLNATDDDNFFAHMKQLKDDATVLLNEIVVEVIHGADVQALAKVLLQLNFYLTIFSILGYLLCVVMIYVYKGWDGHI
jgi:hypothetical protein